MAAQEGQCRYVRYVSRMNRSGLHSQLEELESMLSVQNSLQGSKAMRSCKVPFISLSAP